MEGNTTKIAIIGYGFVGKATEYLLQKHIDGQQEIFIHDPDLGHKIKNWAEIDYAFICVPTNLKGNKLDTSIIDKVLKGLSERSCAGQIVPVIRSTIGPDQAIQYANRGLIIMPEFLREKHWKEDVDNETLGGATTHCEVSGVTDYKAKNDKDALDKIKRIVDKIGDSANAGYNRSKSQAPKFNDKDIFEILPKDRTTPYDMLEIIKRLVDKSEFDQYKEGYGKTILTGYARIDGWAVGIVANQRKLVKTKNGEMQFGGVIYSDSANKASRFIMNCNQKKIPLVFFQDVSGFMVGSRSEHGGIIKDGAKMVNAMANSVVPKFTIIMGNSYGAGNYAMCGKAYDPKLIVGWPTAEIAVMGGEQAAKVLLQIELASLKTKGEKISKEKEKELFENIKSKYDSQIKPYYAASRLWLDAVIDPVDTRKWISLGIEAANNNSVIEDYKTGVIQT